MAEETPLRAGLRERLVELRATLIDELEASPVLGASMLALLGSVGAALLALDASESESYRS